MGTVFFTEGITHLTAKYSVAGPGFLGKSWSRTLWSSCSQTLWPLQEQIGEMVKTGKGNTETWVFQCSHLLQVWVLFRIAKVSSDAAKQFIKFSSFSNFKMLTWFAFGHSGTSATASHITPSQSRGPYYRHTLSQISTYSAKTKCHLFQSSPQCLGVQKTWWGDNAKWPNCTTGSALEMLQIIKHTKAKILIWKVNEVSLPSFTSQTARKTKIRTSTILRIRCLVFSVSTALSVMGLTKLHPNQ